MRKWLVHVAPLQFDEELAPTSSEQKITLPARRAYRPEAKKRKEFSDQSTIFVFLVCFCSNIRAIRVIRG
jgi:hypothetical protein